MKKIILFILSTIFFSFLIFFLGNYFSSPEKNTLHIEENFIEPTIEKIEIYNIKEEKKEKIKVALKSAYNIKFLFFPNNFQTEVFAYTKSFKTFLNSIYIKNKIENLKVEIYKDSGEVRGRMKNKRVKLFGVKYMSLVEFNAVAIHEFAHFIDLYYFDKGVFTDISEYFYNISWEKTKILKKNMQQSDFVSGYSMTNKYEDFAESFTYFVLHNNDFLEKSKKSNILKSKYDFFIKYLFRNNEFIGTDFSENKIKDYYWDITKIRFSLGDFLNYVKK